MRNLLRERLTEALYLQEDAHKLEYSLSILRCLLQAAAIAAVEVCWHLCSEEDLPALATYGKMLIRPSDGDLTKVLGSLIPMIRANGWSQCVPCWFEPSPEPHEAAKPLHVLANDLVVFRNDRTAHGVVDLTSIQHGLQLVRTHLPVLVDGLSDLLPSYERHKGRLSNGKPTLPTPGGEITVESYTLGDVAPSVIRRFAFRGSAWCATYQILDPQHSPAGTFELPLTAPLVLLFTQSTSKLTAVNVYVGETNWNPSLVVPSRQTESFLGREEELKSLVEWWDDSDSRACLVHGEGGIGKTTLVLEFLHGLLDSPPSNLRWRPSLLFFFSAKQTRWGINGLEFLTSVVPSLSDALRSLAQVLDPRLDKTWYMDDSRALVKRAKELFEGGGMSRNEILLIVDNTESLSRSASEEKELWLAFRHISTQLCRLITTSRRHEEFEAWPVEVRPLDSETGEHLLRKLSKVHDAQPLAQAGSSRLRKLSGELDGNPLLLDVLARYVAHTGCSIDTGMRRILSEQTGKLGEFLLEDAWTRMGTDNQRVFLVVGQLGGTVSGQVVGWTCGEFRTSIMEWLGAFDETKFGSLLDYGTNFDIVLRPRTRAYLAKKFADLNTSNRGIVNKAVQTVTKRNADLLRAEQVSVDDRDITAFRTNAAKAAKLAALRGDVDEATTWYQEAITNDANNAALLDRFAWHLMVHGHLDQAEVVASKARAADPSDADTHFTAGMVAARLGKVNEADSLLSKAAELGKDQHLVVLQQTRARLVAADAERLPGPRLQLLRDADSLLSKSVIRRPRTPADDKNLRERNKLIGLLRQLAKRVGLKVHSSQ